MSKTELTKILIGQALKKLASENPLDKVTVQNIVDACGINRKTFYYHFQDKQKLICWIFDWELTNALDGIKSDKLINEFIHYLYLNRDFYVSALTSQAQNNLKEHIFEICCKTIDFEIACLLGERKMSIQNKRFICSYFSNAIIGSIVQWAQQGMLRDPNEYEMDFFPITSKCVKYVVEQYIE